MTEELLQLLLLPIGYIVFVVVVLFGINHMRIKQAEADAALAAAKADAAKADAEKWQSLADADKAQPSQPSGAKPVDSLDVLAWEFEYARVTASEAMRDRHVMINFFIVIFGISVTGIVAYYKEVNVWWPYSSMLQLWFLSSVGIFYSLILIQLRAAWHDSALAMNKIKEFCISNNNLIDADKLARVFRWRLATVPSANKLWNVFFYSAAFIAFMSSAAFACGVALLGHKAGITHYYLFSMSVLYLFILFSIFLFFYYKALEPKEVTKMINPATAPATVVVDKQESIWSAGPFHLNSARLRFQRFDGKLSDPIVRINFERGDSASILLVDEENDSVFLVKQFRFPVYAAISKKSEFQPEDAWLLETVAGMVDAGYSEVQVAKKELLEEAGFSLDDNPEYIASVFASPGGSSEMIHIYLGRVSRSNRVAAGGGVAAEGEDIQVLELPFDRALEMVASGEICDAKTVIALQNLAMRRLREA